MNPRFSTAILLALALATLQLQIAYGLKIKEDPNGPAIGGAQSPVGTAAVPISNHGGPVMGAPVVYVIWYGAWTAAAGTGLVENFLKNIGAHPWWGITKGYPSSGALVFGKSIIDNYSYGKTLTQSTVLAIVKRAISLGQLPSNTNGLYMVLGYTDVADNLFCTRACGWHYYDSATQLKYSFVGNPAVKCPSACAAQTTVSPNNNIGVDAMISVIAHEATEAVTDPFLNAWFDANGYENADKCAWTFGALSRAANGAAYNIVVGGTKYLVQQNWKYPAQACGMS